MPDTVGKYVMVLNEKLQALTAFEDAADIGATKDVLSDISFLQPKNSFLPRNGPDFVMLHTREVMPSAIAEALSNAYEKDKDLHEALTGVHSFPVAIVPAIFQLGQFLQV